MSILRNEKYKGDALLQKTYTADFLSKTIRKNTEELPQYYIENSHPAIISPETFDLVQSEIKRRRLDRRQLNNSSPFAARIICGACGGYYGSKVWHSNSKYRSTVWHCNQKYAGDLCCTTPHMREKDMKAAFVEAFNRILGDKGRYIAEFEEMLPLLADTSGLEKKLAETQESADAASGRVRRCVEENPRWIQDQSEYERRFRKMGEECERADNLVAKIKEEILEQRARKEKIRRYLDELKRAGDIVTAFDDAL